MPSLPGPRWTAQPRLLRALLRTPEGVLDELSSSYGPICGIGAGPLRLAVVGLVVSKPLGGAPMHVRARDRTSQL